MGPPARKSLIVSRELELAAVDMFDSPEISNQHEILQMEMYSLKFGHKKRLELEVSSVHADRQEMYQDSG